MTCARPRSLLLLAESSRRREQRGIDYVSLTKPQQAFVEIDHPRKVWVDGNALGKSYALAVEVVLSILGMHPTWRRRSPLRVLVLGTSYEQMVPLMEKLWTLIPRQDLDPRCGYEPGRGITGKPPRLVFTSGRGAGSEIVFATYRAGASRIAGGQYDLVILDEPPPESVYGEVRPRVLAKHGRIILGFTPVPDMPDITYIREHIARRKMERHNVGLAEENCWPVGFPAPWHWQQEIDAYAGDLLEHERGMRIRGDWEPVVSGRLMRDFSESAHVVPVDLADLQGWYLVVGLDHGTAIGKQTAMLVAVKGRDTERPEVVYLDEHVNEGFTTPEHDAEGIVDLLNRNGLSYDHVDAWVGDVPTSAKTWDVRKSNEQIRRELAKKLGRNYNTVKPFSEPHKFHGSVMAGARMLNTLFHRRITQWPCGHANLDASETCASCGRQPVRRPVARIRPQCEQFIEACRRFDGDKWHPFKDIFDGGRYAVERAITGQVQRALIARY